MKSLYQFYNPSITAGATRPYSVYGRFITLLSNTSLTPILVSLDAQPMQPMPFGISIELPDNEVFHNIKFKNDTLATVKIEFCTSAGRIYDNRVNLSGDIDVTDISDILFSPPAITTLDLNNLINAGAAVNKGGGLVGIPVTAHPFATGEILTVANTGHAEYDRIDLVVDATSSANEVVVTATHVVYNFDGVNDSIGMTTPRNIAIETTQKELIVQNNSNFDIWFGDENVSVANERGTKLESGDVTVLSLTDAVHFQSDTAGLSGATVSFNSLRKT